MTRFSSHTDEIQLYNNKRGMKKAAEKVHHKVHLLAILELLMISHDLNQL